MPHRFWRNAPGPEDRAAGYVLLRDGRGAAHVRVDAANQVWVGISRDGSAPSETRDVFQRRLDHGLITMQSNAGWDAWFPIDDISAVPRMDMMQTLEIQSRVIDGATKEEKKGIATFRLLRARDLYLGDCTYRALDFGARTEIFEKDGSSNKMPGYFTYIPDLMISLTGMWDAGVYGVNGVRTAGPDDWFGG